LRGILSISIGGVTIAIAKTTTLTCRIEPALKEVLRAAAEREYRSIATMVEVLIRDWCGRNGIAMPEQAALFEDERQPPAVGPASRRGRKS
jgi:hypothetical protein